jgi:hypothetical protein
MCDYSRELNFYKPSGAAPASGVVATLVGGVLLGSLLGAVYAFVNHHDPLMYLNVLLLLFFGAVLGGTVSKGVRQFRIRNPFIAFAIAFVVFVVAYAVHWFFYLATVAVDWEGGSSFDISAIVGLAFFFMQQPAEALGFLRELNSQGVWSLTSLSSRSSGISPKGIVLTVIWVVEALALFYYSVSGPWEEACKPYSERQDKWMDPVSPAAPVAFIENVEEFKSAIARNNFSALTTPLKTLDEEDGAGEADDAKNTRFATLTLYLDPVESYISVGNVSIKEKKKKKKKDSSVNTENVVRYLKIPFSLAQSIIDGSGTGRDASENSVEEGE